MRTVDEVLEEIDDLDGQIGDLRREIEDIEAAYVNDFDEEKEVDDRERAADMNAGKYFDSNFYGGGM